MKSANEIPPMASDPGTVVDEPLIAALDALLPGDQCQKSESFSRAYPSILRAIARKVPQKEILATLASNGLKLHPVRYRELLDTERKQRNERGDVVCCTSCGSVLENAAPRTMASMLGRPASEKEQA